MDFLETHAEYGFVGTQCRVIPDVQQKVRDVLGEPKEKEGNWALYGDVMKYAVYGPVARTNTLLFRYNSVVQKRIECALGDYSLEALLASLYGFALLEEECSVYRKHEGGLSNSHSTKIKRMYAEWYRANRLFIKKEFSETYACTKEDIEDGYEYAMLKCAIADGNYKDAVDHRQRIVTQKYKQKRYVMYFHGPFSFVLLRMMLWLNDRK